MIARRSRSSAHRSRFPQAGFTLVEILATIAFAGVLLPSVVQAVSVSLSTGLQARRQAEASALAHSKLCELANDAQLTRAAMSGDFGDGSTYTWEAALSDWEGATLRQLDVTVYWPSSAGRRSVTLSTLIYLPETSP